MRRLIALLASIVLAAACGTAAPTTPAASPPSTAPISPSSPSPESSPSLPALSVRVTFDGEDCVYSGPLVIPSPSLARITYAPTPTEEGSAVALFPIEHGTTKADIDAASSDPKYRTGQGGVAPPFVLTEPGTWVAYLGTGEFDFEMRVHTVNDIVYDAYSIACHAKASTSEETQVHGAIVTMSAP